DQDRWEEVGGYSPFTLAVEVAALLAAADFADGVQEPAVATYLRETADAWNASIERWTYVEGTALARAARVRGYYVRITPTDFEAQVHEGVLERAREVVSPDALALVRYGLRDAN